MALRQKWLRPVAGAVALAAVFAVVALVPRLGATFDGSPSECAAAKIKAVEKKVAAILQCVRKAVKVGGTVDKSCIEKAMSKFTERFTAAESLPNCVTSGDVDTIEAKVDSFIEELLSELLPPDNED